MGMRNVGGVEKLLEKFMAQKRKRSPMSKPSEVTKKQMSDELEFLVRCASEIDRPHMFIVNAIRRLIENMDKEPKVIKPKIICLCGSTRFTEIMLIQQWELTKQGYVVLSWCALPDSYFSGKDKTHIGDQEGVKKIVDEVHLRKIDFADEVFILNVGGYIGESTARELAYAKERGKKIRYLEPTKELGHEVEEEER
jgi:hypothetical protein